MSGSAFQNHQMEMRGPSARNNLMEQQINLLCVKA
jgi:hypothetical protein